MTVSEARQRITNDELNLWIAYIDRNGPLNLALRIDAAVARAVSPFLKGAKPSDLMPWPREPDKTAEAKDVFAMFKGMATNNRERRKQ